MRRATGRSWDCIGHADPTCTASEAACFRGLFLFFNPTANDYSTRVTLPLRYTGAERGGNVSVSWMGGGGSVRPFVMKTLAADTPASAAVDLDYDIEVQLDIAAKGFAVATVKTDDDAR